MSIWTCPNCSSVGAAGDDTCQVCGAERPAPPGPDDPTTTLPQVPVVPLQRGDQQGTAPPHQQPFTPPATGGPGTGGPGSDGSAPSAPENRARTILVLVLVAILLAVGTFFGLRAIGDDGSTERGDSTTTTSPPTIATTRPPAATTSPPTIATTAPPATTTTSPPPVTITPAATAASCESPPGQDAAGNPSSYDPGQAIDGDPATTWRCDGDAVGAELRLTFDRPIHLTEVQLVIGFVKIDPYDGSDRFLQNRRVVEATIRTDDGSVLATFDPEVRTPQAVTLDATTSTLTIVVERTVAGSAVVNDDGVQLPAIDRTPISEVIALGNPVR